MTTAIHDDLFARDVIHDPYSYFGRLREEDPVHWNEKHLVWIITRYADLVWITRHPELFSSELSIRPPTYPPIDASDLGLFEVFRKYQNQRFVNHDRPEHTAMRRVVHGYFTPTYVASWRPLVQSAITDLLDAAEEKGSMDVMADFATPLPVLVIARLMGIPEADRPFIRQWTTKMLFAGRSKEADRMRYVAQGLQKFYAYLPSLIEERIVSPKEDLLSVLVSGEKQGVYTREEVLANAILLLQAGHETTINLLCNGILAFIQHPDQWHQLKQDPAGRAVRATEECLRYDTPVKSLGRTAVEDVELHGKRIRQDDRVLWFISAANRDPRVFPEPDRFHIARDPNPHVAFGSGIHHCLGATLARLEGQEAFKALAQRFNEFSLETEHLEYHPGNVFRSLVSLPVSWH
jgi:cytochrome P450